MRAGEALVQQPGGLLLVPLQQVAVPVILYLEPTDVVADSFELGPASCIVPMTREPVRGEGRLGASVDRWQ